MTLWLSLPHLRVLLERMDSCALSQKGEPGCDEPKRPTQCVLIPQFVPQNVHGTRAALSPKENRVVMRDTVDIHRAMHSAGTSGAEVLHTVSVTLCLNRGDSD
jgi:hypothetical protein